MSDHLPTMRDDLAAIHQSLDRIEKKIDSMPTKLEWVMYTVVFALMITMVMIGVTYALSRFAGHT